MQIQLVQVPTVTFSSKHVRVIEMDSKFRMKFRSEAFQKIAGEIVHRLKMLEMCQHVSKQSTVIHIVLVPLILHTVDTQSFLQSVRITVINSRLLQITIIHSRSS